MHKTFRVQFYHSRCARFWLDANVANRHVSTNPMADSAPSGNQFDRSVS